MLPAGSRRVAMETYWREVQSIEEEREEEEERKSLDGLELEEAWLVQSGLSGLTLQDSSGPVEALLSNLTQRQTHTVKRRLQSYNASLRQRDRQITDVRFFFTQSDSDSDSAPVRPESPKRFHTTTRTIRRHNNRVRPRQSLSKFITEVPPAPVSPAFPAHTPPSPVSPASPAQTPRSPLSPASPAHTPPSPLSPASPAQIPPPEPSGAADWLLGDMPYSEGVAEHRGGGACHGCARFRDDAQDAHEESPWLSPDLSSVGDLSEPDLRNISFIAHIELHTFLLSLGQTSTKTRVLNRVQVYRRKTRGGAVFGVPLQTLLENDRKKNPGLKTPLVFNKLLLILDQSGVETEGILRVSGPVSRLKSLRRDLDRGGSNLDWSGLRPVDAAGLLKLFIRELPSPLLHLPPQTLTGIIELQCELLQLQALQLLCLVLPESHRHTLQELLAFLRRVVANEHLNRMSLWNVSMVMAPNLLHGDRRQEVKREAVQEMEEAVGGAKLIRLLIRHQDLMFTVPCFLLAQVRRMNQASNRRRGPSRVRKRPQQDAPPLCDDVIRVRAPLQLKVSTAMRLDATTTARDVTERFPQDAHSGETLRLYEAGGNIGERRLQPDCLLLDVYRVNPGCDWLIKP